MAQGKYAWPMLPCGASYSEASGTMKLRQPIRIKWAGQLASRSYTSIPDYSCPRLIRRRGERPHPPYLQADPVSSASELFPLFCIYPVYWCKLNSVLFYTESWGPGSVYCGEPDSATFFC